MSNERRLVSPRVAREEYAGGISESAMRRLIKAGQFPAPVVLGVTRRGKPARIAFVVAELLAWVEGRVAERDAGRRKP